jgi:hypothetical protein
MRKHRCPDRNTKQFVHLFIYVSSKMSTALDRCFPIYNTMQQLYSLIHQWRLRELLDKKANIRRYDASIAFENDTRITQIIRRSINRSVVKERLSLRWQRGVTADNWRGCTSIAASQDLVKIMNLDSIQNSIIFIGIDECENLTSNYMLNYQTVHWDMKIDNIRDSIYINFFGCTNDKTDNLVLRKYLY